MQTASVSTPSGGISRKAWIPSLRSGMTQIWSEAVMAWIPGPPPRNDTVAGASRRKAVMAWIPGPPPRNDTVAGASRRKAVASATVPRPGQTTNKDDVRCFQAPAQTPRKSAPHGLRRDRLRPFGRLYADGVSRRLKPPEIVSNTAPERARWLKPPPSVCCSPDKSHFLNGARYPTPE